MLSTSFFKKSLTISNASVSSILNKLEALFGCVYLENNGAPIIGVSPKTYCIYQQQKTHIYNRNIDLTYTLDLNSGSIHDFIQISLPTNKEINNQKSINFNGGYIGFADYNFSANQSIQTRCKSQPNFFLGDYQTFLKYENDQWFFYSHEVEAPQIYSFIESLLAKKSGKKVSFKLKVPCTARWSKAQYRHAFQQVKDYIQAGDCYQINLTQEFTGQSSGNLLDTAEQFWQLTDAPYSGYLKLDDFELLSCSPELFIDFETNRKLVTKPIKGTMPRYEDPILDIESKRTLANSKKDQAENVMIVDLLRNDLSVYAEIGSVTTPKLFEIESFNQVHHMVSEVNATLKEDIHPLNVLFSALPGGSITGAPKIRAMQIIEELEGAPRGAYCGSMGYFNYDGTGSWNILIRSIQKYQDKVSVWAGGGITIASNCDAEYQECFDKVSAMLDLLNTWHRPE